MQQGGGGAGVASDPLTASGSTEDGAAYLASVKAAQQELDAAGGTAPPVSTSTAPAAPVWPGPTTGCSKLAAMKAATQAALAAVGLSETPAAGDSTSGAAAAQAPGAEAGTGATQRQSSTDGRDGAPAPGSFDLGLVNSWSSAATQGPASDADGDGSSSPAAAEKSDSEAVGQACAAEDVVVQVPGAAAGFGLYDLD